MYGASEAGLRPVFRANYLGSRARYLRFKEPPFAGEGTPGSRASSGGPASRPRGQPPRGQQQQRPGAAGAAGAPQTQQEEGSDDGATVAAEPVQAKSWWEKNWMTVFGVGVAVMNLVGNWNKQQQQPQQAAAGAQRTVAGARPVAAVRG